ncbi:MAG TPA: DNA polymerase III subunit gamma/tau [Candidatus Dormibacteraeota bacterium]|nr:DNA polymerase III subunit gamma/tau [Candidatus Dormibacteraeota bacterium]
MRERRALYLRYRSQKFAELVGQDPVARTLRNAIANGQVAHAYLLTGPRGTGKTSTARLIAKAVNCLQPKDGEPCDDCDHCLAIREGRFLDLIEIDAASNRSIDDVRDLREKVRFAPTSGRYKVYVVDEVHQLSADAFNALLKTLEEPPAHVIFVLATTEAHKVPATIVSRTQRFDLRRIPHRLVVETLREIAAREGFRTEDAALEAIARHASGSLRDAESILDQVATFGGGAVTQREVADLLGLADAEEVAALFDALASLDAAKGVALVERLVDDGRDLREFTRRALDHARGLVVAQTTRAVPPEASEAAAATLKRQAAAFSLARLARIVRRLTEVDVELKYGEVSSLTLELAIAELCAEAGAPPQRAETAPPRAEPAPRETPRAVTPPPRAASQSPRRSSAEPTRNAVVDLASRRAEARPDPENAEPPAYPLEKVVAVWDAIVERFRAKSMGLATHLALAEPVGVAGTVLTLAFSNAFARDKVNGESVRTELERQLAELVGPGLRVRCVLSRGDAAADDPMLRAAHEIFRRPDRILEVE